MSVQIVTPKKAIALWGVKFDGENVQEIENFTKGMFRRNRESWALDHRDKGPDEVNIGDWILQGVTGLFFVVSGDEFDEAYVVPFSE